MSDFTRFVTAKLSGEWSAASVAGVLTDIIIEYLVAPDKWEGLDPLVRARLLLAPLFMRRRDQGELAPALAKLAAAGADDKDEWVRATAQSVGPYDGRLHTAALLAGSRLVARTLSTLRQLLDRADTRLFRPQEEVFLNKELLQKLRDNASSTASGNPPGERQPAQASDAPKPHHHFRPRPASEAPSQRQDGAGGGASSAPYAHRPQHAATAQAPGPAAAAGGLGAAARPSGLAAGAAAVAKRTSPLAAGGGGSARPGARLVATDIYSMFLPRKPSLQRPAAGGSLSLKGASQPRRAATLDLEAVKNLHQQRQTERERAQQAAREAAEAETRARAEARAAEKAAREAEKEAEAKRLAEKRAAEKAAREAAAREAREAAKAAKLGDKEQAAASKAAQQEEKAAAAAARAAARAAKPAGRKRAASSGAEDGAPTARRRLRKAGEMGAAGGGGGAAQLPALTSPEATAAALGAAALAAAADAAGMPVDGSGAVQSVEEMQGFLAAAYGQRYSSSDEEEPDV